MYIKIISQWNKNNIKGLNWESQEIVWFVALYKFISFHKASSYYDTMYLNTQYSIL